MRPAIASIALFLFLTPTLAQQPQQPISLQPGETVVNTAPLTPEVPPSVMHDRLLSYIEHIRADMNNWSDTEQKAFLTVLAGATEECNTDGGTTDSPEDLYPLMQLCSTARNWVKVTQLAEGYLKTPNTYKRAEVYTLLIDAYLQLDASDAVVKAAMQMMQTLPYDELVEEATNRAIDALLPYHRDDALALATMQQMHIQGVLYDPALDLVQGVQRYASGMRDEQLMLEHSRASNEAVLPTIRPWYASHHNKLSGAGQRAADTANTRYDIDGKRLNTVIPPESTDNKSLAQLLRQPGVSILIAIPPLSPATQNILSGIQQCQPKWQQQHIRVLAISAINTDKKPLPAPLEAVAPDLLLKLGAYPNPVLLITDAQGTIITLRDTSDGNIRWTCEQ